MEAETLLTSGVRSPVYRENPDKSGRLSGIGHVALFDWDSHADPKRVKAMLRREPLAGPTVVWESSPGNYHGWNLAVRPFVDTANVLSTYADDGKHRRIGEDRGWWRIRTGPKMWDLEGEEYKGKPELVEVYEGSPARISGPHIDLIEILTGERHRFPSHDVIGDAIQTSQYVTFTDKEKLLHA